MKVVRMRTKLRIFLRVGNRVKLFKCVFKKYDKKDQEVQGGAALRNRLPQDVVTSVLSTRRGRT